MTQHARGTPPRPTVRTLLRMGWWAIRWIRPLVIWQAFRYARWRDRVEARWPVATAMPPTSGWEDWGQVQDVHVHPRAVEWVFERGKLEIAFFAADLIRVSWYPGQEPVPYAIARPLETWPEVAFRYVERPDGWTVQTAALVVHVSPRGEVRFTDPEGRVLREDAPPQRAGPALRLRTRLRPEEHIYGLGERATRANRRGHFFVLWNQDPGNYTWGDDPLYLNVPVYLSLHRNGSYLVFFENPYRAFFDLGRTRTDWAEHTFAGGMLRYYVIPGPPARAIERYTELTGRADLPPLWALGYHQSRYSYYPETRVRELVATFEKYDVPVDVIHLDIHYMQGYRIFTWDRERFPNPKALAETLKARGIRLVTIVDPGVKQDARYPVYREGLEGRCFCTLPDGTPVRAPVWPGWCVFPDFTDPEARAWWGTLYRAFINAGIAGFWHDMNEPVVFTVWGERTFPLCTRHAMEGRGGDHAEAHNLYGLLMARAGYEGWRRLVPDRRPFFLSRSGWAGLQRYAWNWTGDNYSDWRSFYLSIPMLIGLGLSGIPFTGPDIGGFQGAPTPELYTRWLQAGVFFPFFRTHTSIGTPDQEPWSFGEPYTRINRETIRWRYRLLFYLYMAAWQAATRGWPVIRPLWWIDPQDERLWAVDDAFLCGDALLVAPVVEEGARWRSVRLPRGLWYDFWTGRSYQGGEEITVDAPLDYTPVFVRAGAVLPLIEPAANTECLSYRRLTLRVYPPVANREITSELYLDSGDGWEYLEEKHLLSRFHVVRDGDEVVIRWTREGAYPWPFEEVMWEWAGESPVRTLEADGISHPVSEGRCLLTRPADVLRWRP